MSRERRAGSHAQPRAGIALMLTLVAILVLEIIAAGTFHVATRQVRTARAAARALHLQLAAQGAAALALAHWHPDSVAALAIDGTQVVPTVTESDGIERRLTLRRVADDLYALRSEALTGLGEQVAMTAVVRTAAPADYLAALDAAARVGGNVRGDGVISGIGAGLCGDTITPSPRPAVALRDSAPSPAANVTLEGAISIATESEPPLRLAGVELVALARQRGPGLAAPAPLAAGSDCMTHDPDNWGAPADPFHPCATFFPVTRVRGDLHLVAGVGQGVLLVEGDAVMAAGTTFHGVMLVLGTLTVEAGATVVGAVRVERDLVLAGGSIRFDACTLARAVRYGRGLRGPFRAAPHWWIPL